MKNFSKRLSCFIFGLTLVLGVGVSLSSVNGKAIESEAASYTGSGTKEDPYTVSDAYTIASGLGSGKNNGKVVYVKGTVTGENIKTNSYGATFDITDGTKTIIAYSITGAQITNSSGSTYIAKDYEVVVGGAILNYNGKYEVGYASSALQASLVSSTAPKTAFKIVGAPSSNIEIGDSGILSVDQDDLTVTWASSNTSVLEITGNTYVAKAGGEATITAKDTASENTVSVDVVVNYGVLTVDEAYTIASKQTDKVNSKYLATVSSKIVKLDAEKGNSDYKYSVYFQTSDGNDFQIFYGYMSEPAWYTQWIAGGTLTVRGNLCKYYDTLELVKPTLVSYSVDADAFVAYFNNKLATPCKDVNADNSTALKTVWADLIKKWADVDEASKKALSEASSIDANYGEAVKLYDHIVKKYGDKLGSGYNFMDRSGTSNISHNVLGINEANNMIPLIVIVSLISVTLVGSLIIIRKRKVN